jgi:hypothetical protein
MYRRAKPLFFSFFTNRAAQVEFLVFDYFMEKRASPPRRRERRERLVLFFLGGLGVSAVDTGNTLKLHRS